MILHILITLLTIIIQVLAKNSTYQNPILPGFHPDPSCIFVPSKNNTYFCASSSFLVFPGIPIHASHDLQTFTLVSNALNRPEQLPALGTTKRATSGIWASTIRYREDEDVFYVFTTMVFDDLPKEDGGRFDCLIFRSRDPFDDLSWGVPSHFGFPGYDVSPYWEEDGRLFVVGTYAWQVEPGIQIFELDLGTGEMGEVRSLWNGTGGSAPEGPHVYKKDGWYYLLIAEGGTGAGHMVTMARARSLLGPYEGYEHNPVLTNGGPQAYFQNIGHADLFQDRRGEWWAVALGVRFGPDGSYPMGRETILTPVTWEENEWPNFGKVSGTMSGWEFDSEIVVEQGMGLVVDADFFSCFENGYVLGPEFVYFRFPVEGNYGVSKEGHGNSIQLISSKSNLTGSDGRSAEKEGQTFLARRQVHSYFDFKVDFDIGEMKNAEQEAGVSVFLDQLHHYDLGIVLLSNSTANSSELIPHFRVRGITTVPTFVSPTLAVVPVPQDWRGQKLSLGITASNLTHYALSAAPVGNEAERIVIGWGNGLGLTWGFTGALLGVYATPNGREEGFSAYVSDWSYVGKEQKTGS